MTQIMAFTPQPRRPGELGVHSVDHFNFVVPDLKQAQKFYTDFGLDVREEGNGLGLYTAGHDHRWGRVGEGGSARSSPTCRSAAFPEDFDRPARPAEASIGVAAARPAGRVRKRTACGSATRMARSIEIRVAEKSSPNEKAVQSQPILPARGAGLPSTVQGAGPCGRGGWRTCAGVLQRHQPRRSQFYQPGGGIAAVRPVRRRGGVHARHPRQRPPHGRLRQVRRAGAAPPERGTWARSTRVGLGGDAHGRPRVLRRVGHGAARARLQLLPLRARPVGQLQPSIRRTSTTSPPIATGPAADHPGDDAFYVWGPNPPADFVVNHETVARMTQTDCAGGGRRPGRPVAGDRAGPPRHRAAWPMERNDRVGYSPRAKTTNVRSREHLRRWGIADALRRASRRSRRTTRRTWCSPRA